MYVQVTKMRCWRIMTVGGGRDNDLVIGGGGDGDQLIGDDHDVCPQQKLELSFEYLMNTGELQWVTVVSTQAGTILIAFYLMCFLTSGL